MLRPTFITLLCFCCSSPVLAQDRTGYFVAEVESIERTAEGFDIEFSWNSVIWPSSTRRRTIAHDKDGVLTLGVALLLLRQEAVDPFYQGASLDDLLNRKVRGWKNARGLVRQALQRAIETYEREEKLQPQDMYAHHCRQAALGLRASLRQLEKTEICQADLNPLSRWLEWYGPAHRYALSDGSEAALLGDAYSHPLASAMTVEGWRLTNLPKERPSGGLIGHFHEGLIIHAATLARDLCSPPFRGLGASDRR